ncbi:MFS transporter [Ideonella paludis]|uniref:MFS transporter n=1 Tax=Ideonella paludis TaxID=1233411 RepID=A0ABS5E3F6_9BURK|nr:MFS transporter [Ideonella paludis]MBQ0937906.1 MFS transporter [Ideonella paludis]
MHSPKTTAVLLRGISANRAQFGHWLLQVLLVGLTLGMTRTVLPAVAEAEFGVPKNSFLLLSTLVMAFGVVKAIMNFVAGRLSERIGRRRVLLLGWWFALPIPLILGLAPSWAWVVAAIALLGVNQGLTWSMTQTAKLDITQPSERGLTLGLNEFAGYVGVALAGLLTAWMATLWGAREGLMVFGIGVTLAALWLSTFYVQDTLSWARVTPPALSTHDSPDPSPEPPSTWEVFTLMSWRDARLLALCQAGLVEKFVDALVWIVYPIYLLKQGLSLPEASAVIGVYGMVWGVSQLITGRWSDRLGRHRLNVGGMWLCGIGVAMMVVMNSSGGWMLSAALTGFGMAMLYPNLSAAVADIAPPLWRGSAIGIYRFWRDLGYALGALGLGLSAHFAGQLESAFWFVALSMGVSGAWLAWRGEETHPSFGLPKRKVSKRVA